MAELVQANYPISPEEYLQGELLSDVRHEYLDGAVYAMAGGTQIHNRISLNIAGALDGLLDGSPCRPFLGDVKVRVKTLSSESYYYPDVVVTCDAEDTNPLFLEKPTTIFEVLSDSTERIDRNEKFLAYTSIPSVQEYVLVRQDRKEVTVARRSNDWRPEILAGDDFQLSLACNEETLTSARVYRNVDFGS